MEFGYIRLWATGPDEETQWRCIAALGVPRERVHVDGGRPTRRRKPGSVECDMSVREQAINALGNGDRLVVACAAALGNSRDDVLKVLGWIENRKAVLADAGTGQEIAGISASIDYAEAAERQLSRMRTEPARRALMAGGRKTGPEKRRLNASMKDLTEMWQRPDLYSVQSVGEKAGLGGRATYLLFKGIPRRPQDRDAAD